MTPRRSICAPALDTWKGTSISRSRLRSGGARVRQALRMAPGMSDAGDPVGRDAAWNRAIALRRIEDQKDAGNDAAPPDGSPGDASQDNGDASRPDSGQGDSGSGGDSGSNGDSGSSPPPSPDAGDQDAGAPNAPDAGPPPPPRESQDDRVLDPARERSHRAGRGREEARREPSSCARDGGQVKARLLLLGALVAFFAIAFSGLARADGRPELRLSSDADVIGLGDTMHVTLQATSSGASPTDPQLGARTASRSRGCRRRARRR